MNDPDACLLDLHSELRIPTLRQLTADERVTLEYDWLLAWLWIQDWSVW
jgi:hypothetical protein